MTRIAWLLVLFTGPLMVVGCGDEPSCIAGDLRLCSCASGAEGRRTCEEDGAFGACQCRAADDGGATDGRSGDSEQPDVARDDTLSPDTQTFDTFSADINARQFDTTPAPECMSTSDCPDDGDACNGTAACELGVCVNSPKIVCSASTVCAIDTCMASSGKCELVPRPDGTPCADGNPCTIEDTCKSGACQPGFASFCECQQDKDCAPKEDGNPCTGSLICNKAAFPYTCVTKPKSAVVCDVSSDTSCSKNLCDPTSGGCKPTSVVDGMACDDGDACTIADTCQKGTCAGAVSKCDCQKDADCAALEDGNLCNGTLRCDTSTPGAFKCVVDTKSIVACDTSKDAICTKTVCVAKTGLCLSTELTGTSCDDGDACTGQDSCKGGACQGAVTTCECNKDADCQAKEDGNLCNGTLFCDKSVVGQHKCKLNPKTIVTCKQDADPCVESVCAPKTGTCSPSFAATENKPCPKKHPCESAATCKSGMCQGVWACPCQPNQANSCQSKEDGNLCNGTLKCQLLNTGLYACSVDSKTVVTCDTSKDTTCSKTQCSPQTGVCAMTLLPDATKCDDGNACTNKDVCSAGICSGVAQPVSKTCPPTWSQVYKAAFVDEGCGGCHGDYDGEAKAYATLKTGFFCGAALVKAGDASGSSIVAKLVAGTPLSCGKKMPDGAAGISANAAKLLKAWINAGAKK